MGCVRWEEEEKPSPKAIERLNRMFAVMEAEIIKKYGYIGVGNDFPAVLECQTGVIYFYDSHNRHHFYVSRRASQCPFISFNVNTYDATT